MDIFVTIENHHMEIIEIFWFFARLVSTHIYIYYIQLAGCWRFNHMEYNSREVWSNDRNVQKTYAIKTGRETWVENVVARSTAWKEHDTIIIATRVLKIFKRITEYLKIINYVLQWSKPLYCRRIHYVYDVYRLTTWRFNVTLHGRYLL